MTLFKKVGLFGKVGLFIRAGLLKIRLGPELVVNGGFYTDTDWTKQNSWTIGGGSANNDGTQAGGAIFQTKLTTGKTYLIKFKITSYTSGSVTIISGDDTQYSAVGTYSQAIIAPNGLVGASITGGSSFVGSIDDFSAREVL